MAKKSEYQQALDSIDERIGQLTMARAILVSTKTDKQTSAPRQRTRKTTPATTQLPVDLHHA